MKKALILTICITLSITYAEAQRKKKKTNKQPAIEVNSEMYSGFKFHSVGPSRGGRATAIAGIADKPYEFYMGSTGGGVWKTMDAGLNWQNISDGQIEAGSIGAIAVAPSDRYTVYVGTGSACPRGNVSSGVGIYKSIDEGESWEFIGLPNAGQVGKIEVHPTNPDIVYVAALGNAFGPNPDRGVYKSTDGGKNWQKTLFVSDSTGAVDLVLDPNNPRILFAAMWRSERKPWTLIDGGLEGGIWKSVDSGETWEKLGGGLPGGLIGRIGLTISPANSKRVWAQIQTKSEEDGGLYRSDDGGKSWKKINSNHKLRQRGWYYSHITADPKDENTIYASNTGFYKSIDGGKTFSQRIRTPHGDNHGVWINPNNTEIMINCNDGGANVTLNGGKSWSGQHSYSTAEFYRVTVDNQFPFRLYAGQQDNTTISVPSAPGMRLTDTEDWFYAGGSESGDVAVNPENPDIIYAGTYSGEITFLDREQGFIRQVTAYPHYTEGTEQRDLKYRWQWNFPIAINPFNPNEVFHTSNYVHKSTNNGQSWEVISPDLTRALDKYHGIPGGPIQHDGTGVEIYSTIFTFEISTLEEGVFWTGSDDGLIHISKDAGKTWQNITPPSMPNEGTVNKISLSEHAKGRAFAAVYRYRDNDAKPYIFRTNDYGQTWEMITNNNGIPATHFVRAVVEDKIVKGLIYAGTEFGTYVSFNDGASWQTFQQNLPVVPITDMEIQDNQLAISTQGRSFWVSDDLGPVQGAARAPEGNVFYKPANAYRTEIWGKNVKLSFYVAEKPDTASIGSLEIIDNSGKVVRKYSTKPDEDAGDQKLNIKQGHNELRWNMRVDGPEIVPDFVSMVLSNPAPGAKIPSGDYTVKLSIGDWSAEQQLEVKIDPNWTHVKQEDLVKQYEMGLEIASVIEESHQLLENIREVRSQANDISSRATDAGFSENLKTSAAELDKALTEVEDIIIQNKIKTSQDAINYPRKFTNHIGRVYSVLCYSEAGPTEGIIERYEDVMKEYAEIKTSFKAAMDKQFVEFNGLLKKENVDHIIIPNKLED